MTIQSIDVQSSYAATVADGIRTSQGPRPVGANVATEPAKAQDAKSVDPTALARAVEQTNKIIQPIATDLQFSVDPGTKSTVVKVVDMATQQVIRQVPSEEMLKIAEALDKLHGLLVRSTA